MRKTKASDLSGKRGSKVSNILLSEGLSKSKSKISKNENTQPSEQINMINLEKKQEIDRVEE